MNEHELHPSGEDDPINAYLNQLGLKLRDKVKYTPPNGPEVSGVIVDYNYPKDLLTIEVTTSVNGSELKINYEAHPWETELIKIIN
jgi:hypothetical protein